MKDKLQGVREGLVGTRYLETNVKLRHSAFLESGAESAVVPFEEREGMEREHTPETGFRGARHV